MLSDHPDLVARLERAGYKVTRLPPGTENAWYSDLLWHRIHIHAPRDLFSPGLHTGLGRRGYASAFLRVAEDREASAGVRGPYSPADLSQAPTASYSVPVGPRGPAEREGTMKITWIDPEGVTCTSAIVGGLNEASREQRRLGRLGCTRVRILSRRGPRARRRLVKVLDLSPT